MAKLIIKDATEGVYEFTCPGCRLTHTIYTKKPNPINASWRVIGDLASPTIKPSVLIAWGNKAKGFRPEEHVEEDRGSGGVCHFFVECGQIRFLNDCTHEYKGLQIEMKDL